MEPDREPRLRPAPWLAALVVLGLGLRLAREGTHGFVLAASGETRLSLARALWQPERLDLLFQGVHPGWLKSPLFPALLAPAVPAGEALPAFAHLVSALCMALLAPALYLLLAPRSGRRVALAGATAVALLPSLLPYAGEYALAGLLLLLAAVAVERGLRAPSLASGAILGVVLALLAAARWEGLVQATLVAGAWTLWASRRPRARLPCLGLGLGLGLAMFGGLQLWAYPESQFLARVVERLGVNALIMAEFAGLAAQQAAFDSLHAQAGGLAEQAAAAELPGMLVWARALGTTTLGGLKQLAQPLLLPWLVAAALGLRSLGWVRGLLALALVGVFLLPAAVMPFKAEYLLPAWLVLAALAGRGWVELGSRRRTLAWLLLALAIVALAVRVFLPGGEPDQRAGLLEHRALAAHVRAELPASAELRAPEDLCVMVMASRTCRVTTPADGPPGDGWWVGEAQAPPEGCVVIRDTGDLILADCRRPAAGVAPARR